MPSINLQFPGAYPGNAPMGVIAGQAPGTAPTPGDTLPYSPTNRVPISTGSGWQMTPALCGTVAPAATITNSFNIDWSAGSIFQYSPTAGQTIWPLFVNQTPGQQISLIVTQPAGGLSYVVWPSGITFVGGTKTLSSMTVLVDLCAITCVSQSVFAGNLGKNVS